MFEREKMRIYNFLSNRSELKYIIDCVVCKIKHLDFVSRYIMYNTLFKQLVLRVA